jgi:glycopeptide antibiotics resistance protein
MREIFVQYIINRYNEIPTDVYECLISLFCLGGVILIALKGLRKGWKFIVGLLAIEYIILFYCATVIFRDYTENVGCDLTPFWSYSAIENVKDALLTENIMNVMAFVPIGLLLSCVSHPLKWWMVLLIGLGISVSIEALQYFFHKGFTEFDDIFHNTLGCAIGIIIVAIVKKVWLLQKKY